MPGSANNTHLSDTRNDTHQDSPRQNKTLLTGSTILKVMHTRELNPEAEISTNPDADSQRIREKLRISNLDSHVHWRKRYFKWSVCT